MKMGFFCSLLYRQCSLEILIFGTIIVDEKRDNKIQIKKNFHSGNRYIVAYSMSLEWSLDLLHCFWIEKYVRLERRALCCAF